MNSSSSHSVKAPTRCSWCGENPVYIDYHDTEWGVPQHDERLLFEFLCLEGAQAGLSWITILKKRENYRVAFDQFDAAKIACYSDKKIQKLLENPGIVRNKLKVNGFVKNAQAYVGMLEQGLTLDDYFWNFVNGEPVQNSFKSMSQVPANTSLSDEISKDLKKRGFTFVGSTIVYAFMQASGMVNDHMTGCFRFDAVNRTP